MRLILLSTGGQVIFKFELKISTRSNSFHLIVNTAPESKTEIIKLIVSSYKKRRLLVLDALDNETDCEK